MTNRKTARLMLGASVFTLALVAPALAGTYHATDDASLRTAIADANADPDPSATIILDNDIGMSGGNLVAPTKPITIDTGTHTLTSGAYNNGSTVTGAINLNGGGSFPAGASYIINGIVQAQGAGASASGTGDQGIFLNVGKTVTSNAAIIGGAGGGLGGAGGNGVGITGASTFTNTGNVTGGSAVNGNGGIGMALSTGPTLINSGTIRGGDGLAGGIGVNGINVALVSITNSGTIQGGKGTTGAGGDGLRFSPGNRALTNNGIILGGDGVTGGWGVNFTGLGTNGVLINNGIIKGGNGSGGTAGIFGAGVIVHAGLGSFTNTGTITGGNGSAAVANSGANISLINSGTLNAGAGYANAIEMQGTQTLTLELHKGSVINGNVVGNAGVANSLILGGDDDASFDVSAVGPQYQNFTAYQKTGNGTWTLTGTGSVATPWAVAQGTLAFGDGASVIGDIANDATLSFTNSNAITFANAVTGTGGVNQAGSGRTDMTGASTYSGPTNISGGTLAVNGSITSAVAVQSGGTLGGNGTVGATTIRSGGTVAPGNSIGILHVNGAFVADAGSVYQVEVDPASNASDLILVDGTATIASGAKLNVVANPSGSFTPGAHYTILTASGGVTGAYDAPAPVSQYLGFVERQDANNIYLDFVQTGDPATAAQTGNQEAVAGGIPAGGVIGTGLLNSQSETDAREAFDKLSGEAIASTRGAVVSGSLLVRDTALDRLRDVCAADETAAHPGCLNGERPLVWVQGFGNWGRIGGNANAAALSHTTGGFLVGTDVPAYDWRLGFFAGYSRTDFKADARSSWGSSDNYHLGTYAGTSIDDVALRLGASYSWSALSTERLVAFGSFANDLTATYNAGTAQIFGEVAERFAFDTFNVEPFANISYMNLRTAGFREGGGEAALSSQANTQEDTFATIGLRPSTEFSLFSLPLTLKGMAGWRHTFGTVTPAATVSFAGGSAFTVTGAPIARDAGVVEAGISGNLTDAAAVNLTYGAQFGGRESNNGIRGTLAIAF